MEIKTLILYHHHHHLHHCTISIFFLFFFLFLFFFPFLLVLFSFYLLMFSPSPLLLLSFFLLQLFYALKIDCLSKVISSPQGFSFNGLPLYHAIALLIDILEHYIYQITISWGVVPCYLPSQSIARQQFYSGANLQQGFEWVTTDTKVILLIVEPSGCCNTVTTISYKTEESIRCLLDDNNISQNYST